jgi:uncharacterized protein
VGARKYYGIKMMLTLLVTFYVSMVSAGYLVELLFGAAGLIPTQRNATVMHASISWNYTTWLNIALLILAAVLVVRFIRTGGVAMLRMMGGSPGGLDNHHERDDVGAGAPEYGHEQPHNHGHRHHHYAAEQRANRDASDQ